MSTYREGPAIVTLVYLVSAFFFFASTANLEEEYLAPLYYAQTPENRIANSYIVVLKGKSTLNQLDDISHRLDVAAKSLSGEFFELKHFYRAAALNGFSAKLSKEILKQLRKFKEVAYITEDGIASAEDQVGSWGQDRIDQRYLPLDYDYSPPGRGNGTNVYIVDTGILYNHTEFEGRAHYFLDTVNDGRDGWDCDDHGTHVAGTVGGKTFGVAKEVTLWGVRVLDCGGSGSWSNIIKGLDYIAENGSLPGVLSMSLGGDKNQAVDDAVQNIVDHGFVICCSAGNSDLDACSHSPGGGAHAAITVGASEEDDFRAYFSNYGPCVDIFAPGRYIISADLDCVTCNSSKSGTSMATPHVSGVAAILLAKRPDLTPYDVKLRMKNAATSGVLLDIEEGSPNLLLYVDIPDWDIEECLNSTLNNCSVNAVCSDTVGSYTCECQEGTKDDSPDPNEPGRVCRTYQYFNTSGNLTSRGYPGPYPDADFIDWEIAAPLGMHVRLDFVDFETERGFDFLTIYNGSEGFNETMVLQVSGSKTDPGLVLPMYKVPDYLILPGPVSWVTFFTTDFPTEPSGFLIKFSMTNEEPSISLPPTPKEFILTNQTGEIMTPGWPENYDNNLDITWYIEATDKGKRIDIEIYDFHTEENYDFLRIGQGKTAGWDTQYQLTGSGVQPTNSFSTNSSLVWLKFTSDWWGGRESGFKLTYKIVDVVNLEECGPLNYDKDSGMIESPKYFESYPPLLNCLYIITLPSADTYVKLKVESFDTEQDHDFLIVGSGSELNENVTVLSGNMAPLTLYSSQKGEMWMRFITDQAISGKGFHLHYESVSIIDSCGDGDLLGNSGKIESPEYPDMYPPSLNCLWTIELESIGSLVQLNFEEFNLESGKDFLIVGSGPIPDMDLIDVFTGEKLPASIRSTSHRMWMRFINDHSMESEERKYLLSFEAVKESDDNIGKEQGEITVVIDNHDIEWYEENAEQMLTKLLQLLNEYCNEGNNCELESKVTLGPENIHVSSVKEVGEDLEITFWVSHPEDSSRAALASTQLYEMLDNYNEENPELSYNVQNPEEDDLSWTDERIAWVVLSCACVILLVICLALSVAYCKKDSSKGVFAETELTGMNNNGGYVKNEKETI